MVLREPAAGVESECIRRRLSGAGTIRIHSLDRLLGPRGYGTGKTPGRETVAGWKSTKGTSGTGCCAAAVTLRKKSRPECGMEGRHLGVEPWRCDRTRAANVSLHSRPQASQSGRLQGGDRGV